MPLYNLPTLRDVEKASQLIEHKITKTPTIFSYRLDDIANTNVRDCMRSYTRMCNTKLFIKCENLQRTGSFKFRGASHFLARLQDSELAKGVVAYSTGTYNHQYTELMLKPKQETTHKPLPMPFKSRLASAQYQFLSALSSPRIVQQPKSKLRSHTTRPYISPPDPKIVSNSRVRLDKPPEPL